MAPGHTEEDSYDMMTAVELHYPVCSDSDMVLLSVVTSHSHSTVNDGVMIYMISISRSRLACGATAACVCCWGNVHGWVPLVLVQRIVCT